MKYCIDRFEGDFAVLECDDKSLLQVPRSSLYDGAKEGDWISFDGNKYVFLEEETNTRRQKNIDRLKRMMGE